MGGMLSPGVGSDQAAMARIAGSKSACRCFGGAKSVDSIDDRDRACPAGGAAAHLHREAAHGEAFGRERLEIVQLLDVAVADLAAGAMAFPDDLRVVRLGVAL